MAIEELNTLELLIEGFDATKLKQNEDLYDEDWKKVIAARQNNKILQATVTGLEKISGKHCAVVSVGHIRGYIPIEVSGVNNLSQLRQLTGKKVVFKVLEYTEEEGNKIFIASRTDAQKAMAEITLRKIKEGDEIYAVAQSVTATTVYADIGGIEVKIPLEEIRYGWIDDLREEVKVGDHLKVKVLSITYPEEVAAETDGGTTEETAKKEFVLPKIKVSAKALQVDPWETAKYRYKRNGEYVGVVSGVRDYGTFINLEDGVDTLAKHLRFQNVQKGDKVLVRILGIDEENRRINSRIVRVIN